MRLILQIVEKVRHAVGPNYPVAIKLNATHPLEGGLSEADSLRTINALDQTDIDLIEASGGTYFPGGRAVSESSGGVPYFVKSAERARSVTDKPLMVTGGFKTIHQACEVIGPGINLIGLARALVLDSELPNGWLLGRTTGPGFPKFSNPPEGAATAWYTRHITGGRTRTVPPDTLRPNEQ